MSIETTADKALRKVQNVIMAELPKPTCASKHEHWQWQVEQVKKKVVQQLWPESNGVSIEIKV